MFFYLFIYLFIKVYSLKGFPNVVPYFPKYRGSQIKFVSSRILAGVRHQHRNVFLIPFSEKRCQGNFDYLSALSLARS